MEQRKRHRRPSLGSIVEFMPLNLRGSLRLEDFAKQVGMSVSHFSDLFRAQTGQSPTAHFINIRMRHACRLPDLGGQTVKSVGIKFGIASTAV